MNTPRTDAAIEDYGYRDEGGTWVQQMAVPPSFARQLERELIALRQELTAINQTESKDAAHSTKG